MIQMKLASVLRMTPQNVLAERPYVTNSSSLASSQTMSSYSLGCYDLAHCPAAPQKVHGHVNFYGLIEKPAMSDFHIPINLM